MWTRIKHMIRKEFIQVLRDPRMRSVIFILPIVQLLILGNAMNTDVKDVQTAILDQDNTPASRKLIDDFRASPYFKEVVRLESEDQISGVLDREEAQLVLHINRGFQEDLEAGKLAPVQAILDGTDSNTTGIVLGYSRGIINRYNRDVVQARVSRVVGRAAGVPGVDLRTRAWFNENLESSNYFVPGIMAILVTIVTLILTSMAVVREKEVGTMEQLIVTPITPMEFILGKTLPFGVIGMIDVTVVTIAAMVGFSVPLRGNLLVLFAGSGLYLLSAMGVGLLISTVSETQQQAMMGTFFFMLPSVLLSGLMFPIENMPVFVQWLTVVNPMRYYLVIIRFVFQKGAGFELLLPQMGALLVMGVVMTLLATKRFRKTIV
jgi:ABC-2 type transport system permease protein